MTYGRLVMALIGGDAHETTASADVVLADGSLAVLRLLRPEDGPALHDLHEGVSDESIRLRFFGPSRHGAHTYVDHVLNDPSTLSLVAETRGRLIGLATAEPVDASTSEVAFLVADDARGLGVGTLLIEHLAEASLLRGVTHFEADVLAENQRMLRVFNDAGFQMSRRPDGATVVVALTTGVSAETLALADAREFSAESRSLGPLLRPTSVVVVGVRSDGTGIGATVLRSIVANGFQGRVAAVHPRASQLCGVKAYRSVLDVPEPVDLVVLCVPAKAAPGVLDDAAAAGAQAVIVVSSGFSELGEEGRALQRSLAVATRGHGIRMVGPNCLGLLCNAPDVRLNATFNEAVPPAGGLAVASQSGGVGIVLMDLARELGLGVHTFVSLGNKADVSSNDLLAAWFDDPRITAAALYLESFGNAAKFARFARRFAMRKPLLAVVGGRSAGGSRAGASHTAAAATPAVGVDALFAQAGVIACTDAEDLARTALLLAEQPLPAGRRLAVVSNAGGIGVLAADAAAEAGLEIPEFSPALQARLAGLVNGTTGTSNPVDAGADVPPTEFAAMVDAVLASGEADAVLVIPVATGVTDGRGTLAELIRVRADHPDLPVVAVPLGGLPVIPSDPPLTTYRSSASAVRALGRAARYAEWRAVPRGPVAVTGPHELVARRQVTRELVGETGGGWLLPDQASRVLEPYGLAPVGRTVRTADDAAAAATEFGFPVAVKVADPEIVHKTDRGLVRVGLGNAEDVRHACADFDRELGRAALVLVQPVLAGVEVALGLVRDAALGPLVMVAAGGIATDVWDDRVFLVPPLADEDAARALRSLRVWPLLDGYRGAPPTDTTTLEAMVLALGRLAVDLPEVAELDVNPVLVGPGGCSVVDVKLRVGPPIGPAVSARQLRPV